MITLRSPAEKYQTFYIPKVLNNYTANVRANERVALGRHTKSGETQSPIDECKSQRYLTVAMNKIAGPIF